VGPGRPLHTGGVLVDRQYPGEDGEERTEEPGDDRPPAVAVHSGIGVQSEGTLAVGVAHLVVVTPWHGPCSRVVTGPAAVTRSPRRHHVITAPRSRRTGPRRGPRSGGPRRPRRGW